MQEKGLVSIITPCYNGARVVHRLVESILNQTYSRIEFIFVNDGSTDDTEEVIKSYKQKFDTKGIIFKYIYQENRGLGGAIDTGLKYFTGEYLCWPDADDYLALDSIEKRKNFLDLHPDYQLVRSDAYLFDEKDLSAPVGFITGKKKNRFREEGLFKDYLLEKDVIFCPGCHMVRSSAFLSVNPARSIFPAKRGQNFQMLLPLVYKYKFAFMDEPLYNYVIYSHSMSRGDDTYQKCIIRFEGIKEIITETLKKIPLTDDEKIYYQNLLRIKELHSRCRIAFHYFKKEEFLKNYSELKKNNELTFREYLKWIFIHFPYLVKSITTG